MSPRKPTAKAEQPGAFAPYSDADVTAWELSLAVSQSTRRNYRLGLASFCEWLRMCAVEDPADVDASLVVGFKEYLGELGASASRVSLYLAGVRSFMRSFPGPSPAGDVRGAKAPRGFRKSALSLSQARAVLARMPRGTEAADRDYALVTLMLHTGLRDVEAVRADVGDVVFDSGYCVLRVQGKGRDDSDQVVKLAPAVTAALGNYLAHREVIPTAPLFASVSNSNKGGRLTTRSVSGICKSALRAAGLDDPRLTAHSLRHTAVTLALLGGASESEAQLMARHADISTTMLYSHHLDRLADAAEDKIAALLDS